MQLENNASNKMFSNWRWMLLDCCLSWLLSCCSRCQYWKIYVKLASTSASVGVGYCLLLVLLPSLSLCTLSLSLFRCSLCFASLCLHAHIHTLVVCVRVSVWPRAAVFHTRFESNLIQNLFSFYFVFSFVIAVVGCVTNWPATIWQSFSLIFLKMWPLLLPLLLL